MNPADSKMKQRRIMSEEKEAPVDFLFKGRLEETDPTVARMAELEQERQLRKLILIASESVCPDPVRDALASSFNNIYAEGYPSWRMTEAENRQWADLVTHLAYFRRYSDLRYYRGCDYANFVESIAQKRIKEIFATESVSADCIFANVQPLSGAAANNAVYQALVPPGSDVVGMSLVEGGHLTHGSPANRSGKNYRIASYGISPKTGRIDYEQVEKLVRENQPKMLIGGASAYPWHIDWDRLRQIADTVEGGCFLLADIAHYAGLVAGGQYPNPVGIADAVTFTTHKSLCGPRGAVILTTDRTLSQKMNVAVFPGEQGGPHVGNIAAKAVAFHLAGTGTFKTLMERVVNNSKALAAGLEKRDVKVCYGGTESHLCLVDLKSIETKTGIHLSGEIAGRLLDLAGIVVNKNTVRGDRSAVHPSAIRLGTVWVSQLGYDEADMDRLAGHIATVLKDVRPFRYIDGAGYVGRGKLNLDVMEDVRDGVNELIESRLGPPSGSQSGYPHFDSFPATVDEAAAEAVPTRGAALLGDPGLGLLEVESERAHYFMQSVGTADLSRLQSGDSARTVLLNRKGEVIDDVLVLRLDERVEGWHRYQVITNARSHALVRRWFRALSDGYVLFDDDDIYRKVEGPVMVEDPGQAEPPPGQSRAFAVHSSCEGSLLREAPEAPLRALAIIGPDSDQMVKAIASCDLDIHAHANGSVAGIEVRVVREAEDAFVLLVPADATEDVVSAFGEATKGSAGVLMGWRKAAGLASPGDSARAVQDAHPELFGEEKVYYVGQAFAKAPEGSGGKEWKYEAEEVPLRETPLHGEHIRLGQKEFMVPFGGWSMPVRYGSIMDEHNAVRTAAGLFDVSHMGVLEVRGDTAQRFLDAVTSNYVAWLWDGQCHYSYLLDPDGHVLDDILVYRRAHDRILVVVNAANAEKDEAWLRAAASGEFFLDRDRKWVRADGPPEIVNLRDPAYGKECRVDLALQGPRAFEILEAAADNAVMMNELSLKKRFEFVEGSINGIDALISTTGYTGEKVGFEILVRPDQLLDLWKLLLEKGEPMGIRPAGLGARDSTRIEAGFPLWGHELAGEHDINPIEAGYGGAVKFHKPFFVGRGAMRKAEEARKRQIVRFHIEGKGRMLRAGAPLVGSDGKYVGVVTSNTQVGDRQVGLALVDRRSIARGTDLHAYRMPPNLDRLPEPKRMDSLEDGDSVLLPTKAKVVKRFL